MDWFFTLPVNAAAFLILFARVGGMLMLLPVFSDEAVPGRVRLLVSGGLAAGLFGLLGGRVHPFAAAQDAALAATIVSELLVGLSLGMVIRMMFQAISVAGSIISLQIGLSAAIIFDPGQAGHAAILSKFVGVAAALVCMALGVHHLWLGALVKSYDLFPVGGLPPFADFATLAVKAAGDMTALGLSLAAPLVVFGLIFNFALGLASRVAPAIQLFFIAQPLNLLVGLSVTAVVLGAMLSAFAEAMAAWMDAGWG